MVSLSKRPDGAYRARYRDPDGREHSKHFRRKTDAQTWLNNVTAAVVTGTYVDPGAGDVTFREYAEAWRKVQVQQRASTREQVERNLIHHTYPVLGGYPLSAIRPSQLQAWVASLSQTLAPATVALVFRYVKVIFDAAVQDQKIAQSPCKGVKLPKRDQPRVEAMSVEDITAVRDALPERLRATVTLAAGAGLRQGEVFGLTLDRVDFLRRHVRVDRQLSWPTGGEPTWGPLKTDSSDRTVPLPDVVLAALSEHVRAFPPGEDGLLFTTESGRPWRRSGFSVEWRRACREAGVQGRTFHALRHAYASILIQSGESIRTVSERLGHKNATVTLTIYSHMLGGEDATTRTAVDAAFTRAADSLRTAGSGG